MNFVDTEGNIVMDGIFIRATNTGIEDVVAARGDATKTIRDGQLLIIRDGKQYNALGQLIY